MNPPPRSPAIFDSFWRCAVAPFEILPRSATAHKVSQPFEICAEGAACSNVDSTVLSNRSEFMPLRSGTDSTDAECGILEANGTGLLVSSEQESVCAAFLSERMVKGEPS